MAILIAVLVAFILFRYELLIIHLMLKRWQFEQERKRATAPASTPTAVSDLDRAPAEETPHQELPPAPATATFAVAGLPQDRELASRIERRVSRLDGVLRAYVSPFTGLVYVSYLPSRVDNSRLGDVLEGVGKGPGVTAEPRVRLLPMKAGITAAGRTS
jgi:hypothetical protein